ncbi:sensor histidine kinase [Halobaculum limi]|uniref:sensor histidine kinase n=1 Tax=Halobaculum limi TaxID=3031916 RepID=UPI002405F6E1|nr:GAF domain-containing sensor histidine kinase [Halobaculum sp. YSMS11]
MVQPPAAEPVDDDLHGLRTASRQMARAEDTTEVADAFVNACVRTLGVDLAAVRGYDPRRDALDVVAASDAAGPYLDGWGDHRRGDDDSPAWRAYVTGDPQYVESPDSGTGADPVSYALYLPLGSHAVATVATLDTAGFGDRTRYLLETLASDATAALDAVVDRRGLAGLHDATRLMQCEDDAEVIVAIAVDATEEVLGIPYSNARLRKHDSDAMPVVAVSDAVAKDVGVGDDTADERIAREAFETGSLVVRTDGSEGSTDGSHTPFGVTAVYPLGDHGTLTVALPEGMPLGGRRRELARVLADNTTGALDRAERTARLREQASTIAAQDERLEEFANVVSHDLRNPLNVAKGRLDLGRDRVDDEEVAADLDIASEALDRVADIVDNARMLAVGEEVGETDLLSVAEAATAAWSAVETGDAELLVEAECEVAADPGLFAQLFENAFRNAIEHAGGAPRILVTDTDDGFAIEDDGPGIPPDERGAVFRIGYSGDGGTGLGLGIIARVVEAHGWTVRIEDGSRFGGARFVIEP